VGEIKRQGIQNSIISYSGIAISFVSVLILQPLFLTPDELGLTRFLASFSIIAGVVFTLGLSSFTIRHFPAFRNHENGHNGYLRLLLLITTGSFLFFAALAFIFRNQMLSWFSNSPVITEHFIYLVPISLSFGFNTVLTAYSIALFRSSFPVFLTEVYVRVAIIGAILLYHSGVVDFDTFVFIYMLCYVSQIVILFFYLLRVDNGMYHPINRDFWRAQDWRAMIGFLLWAAPGSLATIALRQIDVTMLGSDLNRDQALKDVAVYTIGFTIGLVIEAPYNAFSRIGESKLSDAIHRKDNKMIENVYKRSTRVLMIVGAFLYMGVCVNIRQLLSFLPGKYEASFWVVIIIGATSFFNMATGINNPMIFFSDKFKKGTLLIFGLILTSLTLNFILIPLYGIIGAAIATGTSLLLFNLAKMLLTWHWFGLQPYGKYAIYVIVAFTLALVTNYFLPSVDNRIADMLIRSSVVTVIYGSIILFSKVLPEANAFIQKHTGIKV
jgi:O-antigen/teichoic acid export membrane protein